MTLIIVCMYECMSMFFCVVLHSVGRGTVMGGSPIQRILPKCLKELTVSGISSEPEQATEPNP